MKTKKKFPSYDIILPRYPSLKILYNNLAFQDANFQANQIILEYFPLFIKVNKLDGKQTIKELAKKFKLSAGTDDINRIKKMMAESYIVHTYNIAELFFKKFNKDFKSIHKLENWITTEKVSNSNKSLDPLNQLLKNLDDEKRTELQKLPEYLLCNYYRLLRNSYVHREIDTAISIKKPQEYFDKHISGELQHFEKYYKSIPKSGAPAPSSPSEINFHDFILFSRSLRNLANYINDYCNFSVSQAFELAEQDDRFFNTPKKINYHSFPQSKPKLTNYLTKYYISNFGTNQKQINEFINLFYEKY